MTLEGVGNTQKRTSSINPNINTFQLIICIAKRKKYSDESALHIPQGTQMQTCWLVSSFFFKYLPTNIINQVQQIKVYHFTFWVFFHLSAIYI